MDEKWRTICVQPWTLIAAILFCSFVRVTYLQILLLFGCLVDYKIYISLFVSCGASDACDAWHVCGGCTFLKLWLCDACDGCRSPGVCVCNEMDVNFCVFIRWLIERDSRRRICDTCSECVWRRILDAFGGGTWKGKPAPRPGRLRRRRVLKGIGYGSGKRSAEVLNGSRAGSVEFGGFEVRVTRRRQRRDGVVAVKDRRAAAGEWGQIRGDCPSHKEHETSLEDAQ